MSPAQGDDVIRPCGDRDTLEGDDGGRCLGRASPAASLVDAERVLICTGRNRLTEYADLATGVGFRDGIAEGRAWRRAVQFALASLPVPDTQVRLFWLGGRCLHADREQQAERGGQCKRLHG